MEAILNWIFQIPHSGIPIEILVEMVFRRRLISQASNKMIDILAENPEAEFKTKILINLLKNRDSMQLIIKKIVLISESFSEN